jgi:DnaK suppressor protein
MLNLPQNTLTKLKSYLLRQQQQVEEEIKSLETDDPVLMDAVAESSEPGTDSFQADIHSRLVAAKTDLSGLLINIKSSLSKMNKGTYGVCEKCGKQIETERLEAMPTATLCITCSKKAPRR